MPRTKLEKTRLAVDVPAPVKERLEALRSMTEADSMSEVVRRALAVYEMLVQEGGRRPTFLSEDGTKQRIVLY